MRSEIEILKKRLAASESQASLAGDPNIRVLEVLKQLGIEAVVQGDGTLVLPDGRVLGSALALPGGDLGGVASAASLGIMNADFDNALSGASAELQELVADLTQQLKMTKTKLRTKKEENERVKNQLGEQHQQHQQIVLSMKRSNQQLSHELSQKAQKLEVSGSKSRRTSPVMCHKAATCGNSPKIFLTPSIPPPELLTSLVAGPATRHEGNTWAADK